ncbi:right-handed parallel beta-helix repeat-containing protein [Candidatus Bipolaricaulota bacterium]|nr:right-handed parallel beta-helix repeat-containing protein [Candidatus Bipolaricaulota bacterium]
MRNAIVLLAVMGMAALAWGQGWGPHAPIFIHGDDQFTWENGVTGGSGTAEDPYVIEGWIIDTKGYDYGIYIDRTRAHFVIRNCQIRYPQEKAGIMLSAVRNGRIEGTSVYGGRVGIHLLATSDTVVTGSAIGYCDYGIVISTASERNVIYGNSVIGCGFPATDEGRDNRWHHEGRGNHWSDYRGPDLNKDGIGDTPYELVPDRYPLIEPPVKLPEGAVPMRTVNLTQVGERGIVALAPESLLRLTATDIGVGVDKILYRLDGGEWIAYKDPFPVPAGRAMVRMEYYAVDKLGNREPVKSLTIYLDIQPPVTRIVAGDPHYLAPDGKLWITSRTTLELRSEDASGTANIFFRIDEGVWRNYIEPFTISGPEGPHKVDYYAIDLYGNREAVQSAVLWKDDSAPSTQPSMAEGGKPPFEEPAPKAPVTEIPAPSAPQPPVTPPALAFRITLTQANLVEDLGVGSDWKLSCALNGEVKEIQTASLPLLLYRGAATELSLTLWATEVDEAQDDVGEHVLTLSPPWTVASYDLEVVVYEDGVQTSEKLARWRFTVEVEEGR